MGTFCFHILESFVFLLWVDHSAGCKPLGQFDVKLQVALVIVTLGEEFQH